MELQSYLTVLRKSWLLLLVTILLGAAGGTALYLTTPKTYQTSVDFYVSTPTSDNTNPQSSGQFGESRVNSYIVLLSSEELAQRVVSATRVDLTPLQVSGRIAASAKINTVVVNASVTDVNPQRSLQIARGVAATFPQLVDELDNAGRAKPVVVVHTVSGPTLQTAPVGPDPRLYVGVGVLLGLLVGLAITLVRAASARRPQPVEEKSDAGATPQVGGGEAWGTRHHDEQETRTPVVALSKR